MADERLPLRSTYRWIPSEFRICSSPFNSNGLVEYKVHIETPILHLPMNEQYEQTYRNLEKIFEKLVPMFKKLNVLNTGEVDTRLQVIVKVQSYNIKPGKFKCLSFRNGVSCFSAKRTIKRTSKFKLLTTQTELSVNLTSTK
jgi:hypothetical protein